MRGPNGAQFGSDSIGGSVQLVSQTPLFAAGKTEVHGQISSHYYSADLGFGGNSLVTFGAEDLAVLINLASHRSNNLRPGGGIDTHAAVNRFLGIRSGHFRRTLDRHGVHAIRRLVEDELQADAARPAFVLLPARANQDGGKRFDQTLGGDGNLIADLRNFMLDFFYGRYERFGAGPSTRSRSRYSYNAQREERVNQGGQGNPLGAITNQYERTAVHSVQGQAARQWSRIHLVVGGEFYYDRVRAPSFAFDPANGAVTPARPRVPDKATYRSGGLTRKARGRRFRKDCGWSPPCATARAAYDSRAANSPLVNGQRLWPDDQLTRRRRHAALRRRSHTH